MIMPAPYAAGDPVQFFDGTDKRWKPGKYVGPLAQGFHIVRRRRTRQTVQVTDNWLRRLPDEFNLTGHVAIFQRDDGTLALIGPKPDHAAAQAEADNWTSIFGDPLGIVDLTPHQIAVRRGQGINNSDAKRKATLDSATCEQSESGGM